MLMKCFLAMVYWFERENVYLGRCWVLRRHLWDLLLETCIMISDHFSPENWQTPFEYVWNLVINFFSLYFIIHGDVWEFISQPLSLFYDFIDFLINDHHVKIILGVALIGLEIVTGLWTLTFFRAKFCWFGRKTFRITFVQKVFMRFHNLFELLNFVAFVRRIV